MDSGNRCRLQKTPLESTKRQRVKAESSALEDKQAMVMTFPQERDKGTEEGAELGTEEGKEDGDEHGRGDDKLEKCKNANYDVNAILSPQQLTSSFSEMGGHTNNADYSSGRRLPSSDSLCDSSRDANGDGREASSSTPHHQIYTYKNNDNKKSKNNKNNYNDNKKYHALYDTVVL